MSRSRGGRRRAGCSSSPGSFSSRSGRAHEHFQALGKIMDLGIRGKTALVCAASKGLGKGCAASLAAEGRQAALRACAAPDILVNNAGGPPPGDFRDWDRETWIKALEANMIAPILLIRAVVDGMMANSFGRIINITSGAVKYPIPELGLSNGARTGLTGFIAGLSRKTVRHNVTINNLLPGPFDTDRLRSNFQFNAKASGKSYEELRKARAEANPSGRFGRIEEFGDACAYLCSAQAGYITGQNLLLDGGAYPGTF